MFRGSRFWPGRYLLYRERVAGLRTYWDGTFDVLGFAAETLSSDEAKGFVSARHAYAFAKDHAPRLNDWKAMRVTNERSSRISAGSNASAAY